jgi:hypothetical protein
MARAPPSSKIGRHDRRIATFESQRAAEVPSAPKSTSESTPLEFGQDLVNVQEALKRAHAGL